MIRLLLADDHNILRQGLSEILERYSDIYVVAEVEDGQSMIVKYFDLHPDIVLSDIEMPILNGIEAAEKILRKDANAKIIFLTMHHTDEYVYKALQLGAFGLVSKEVIKGELLNAIRIVADGKKYFMGKTDEEIRAIRIRFDIIKYNKEDSRSVTLTVSEKKVLLLIADGKTSDQIALELRKAKRTIDSVRSSIMGKLNLKSLPQLIKYALEYTNSLKEKV